MTLIDLGLLCFVPVLVLLYGMVYRKSWKELTEKEILDCLSDTEFNKIDWCPDHFDFAKHLQNKIKEMKPDKEEITNQQYIDKVLRLLMEIPEHLDAKTIHAEVKKMIFS